MNIRELIREELKEIKTTQKTKYGQGMEHSIYPSQKFPDRLFKIGEREIVEEWVKIFQSNPTIFPKIYKVGKVTDKKYKDAELYYVYIEKLDTAKAEKEWDYMHDKMEELGIINEDLSLYGRDFTDIYINHGDDRNAIEEILKSLMDYDERAYDIFLNWFTVVKKCQQEKEKIVGHETYVDAHKYNFGYGKDGKLKCLDI